MNTKSSKQIEELMEKMSEMDYDDIYMEGYETGAESGDLNLDGVDNVLDIVILVDNILNP